MENQNTAAAIATAAPAAKSTTTIVHSPEFKGFVQEQTGLFSAPSKSRDDMPATEKEITNAMLAFVQTHRIQLVPTMETIESDGESVEIQSQDADGNPLFHEVDLFALEVKREMALRASTTRTSSKDAKIAELEAQLAALLAKQTAGA